ncbi:NAD-dependent epimerase/dehydratase family protein [Nocardioides sp.]|uniref:NAD-dependent epimerase/dehydratase family protein n=1 Tax=Nocardioides sp. TaxID=35761 RepID=UPI0035276870
MRVLVTGAAGSLGRTVTVGLADRGHEVVGLDLLPEPEGFEGGWHAVDCADADAVAAVFTAQPLDAVVHLAGNPDESSLPEALTSHVVSTAALLDAMVDQGVRRLVYASSNHAVGGVPRVDTVDAATLPRPDTFYGVAKVAAEALLRLYADRYGFDTVACRIGSFRSQPESVRELATWLSPDDAVRMVEAALTAPAPGFAVLYGVSANARGWWDLEPGRGLGYDPLDDAEDHAAGVTPGPDDAAETAHVGGPFLAPSMRRPALD